MKLREIFTEARFSDPIIAYHGTDPSNIPTILSQGLVPERSGSGWGSGIGGSQQQRTMDAIGGVYFTSSFDRARRIPRTLTPAVVIAQVQPRSAFMDEDDIANNLIRTFSSAINMRLDGDIIDSLVRINLMGGDDLTTRQIDAIMSELNRRGDDISDAVMAHPGSNDLLFDLFQAELERNLAHILARSSVTYIPLHIRSAADSIRDALSLDRDEAFETAQQFIDSIPDVAQAEDNLRYQLDRSTRSFKRAIYHLGSEEKRSTIKSFRINERVGFSGANKILAIVIVHDNDLEVVYGEIPSEANLR